ncbi:NADH-quinone oxidoreductase subunit H [Amnibacterium setariae]|uniref:Uncharacterized protein n=1 Tax=Amnibacterium setariae TaxID=2306585 RepID=A0A3A1U1M6_9MICO|nr:NADH-quinone oxidoreductase subunit H [Amnibacterium setariae]RIX30815.1 hypothetical protein D1781_05305 [Amnibacterium setariae]
MPDAVLTGVLAAGALLVLGLGVAALRAVLDGVRLGVPASIAVLGPAADAARCLRTRPSRGAARPTVAGALLLASALVRVLALPVLAAPLLGGPLGIGWLVVADAVWLLGLGLLDRRRLLPALAVEPALLLALAVPVVSTGSLDATRIVQAQSLPVGIAAPVAVVVLLVAAGALLPEAVPRPGRGPAGLLVSAALAAQPVAAAATAAVLLLGLGGPGGALPLAAVVIVLGALLVLLQRRFPVPRPRRLAGFALAVLLPLAAVQLAVVVALALLAP